MLRTDRSSQAPPRPSLTDPTLGTSCTMASPTSRLVPILLVALLFADTAALRLGAAASRPLSFHHAKLLDEGCAKRGARYEAVKTSSTLHSKAYKPTRALRV